MVRRGVRRRLRLAAAVAIAGVAMVVVLVLSAASGDRSEDEPPVRTLPPGCGVETDLPDFTPCPTSEEEELEKLRIESPPESLRSSADDANRALDEMLVIWHQWRRCRTEACRDSAIEAFIDPEADYRHALDQMSQDASSFL